MKRWIAASLALLFYASILPWANAEPFKSSSGAGSTVRGTDGTDYEYGDLFDGSYSLTAKPGDLIVKSSPYVDVRAYATLALAEAALPSGDYGGGTLLFHDNTNIGDWSPTRKNLVIKGVGQYRTVLSGRLTLDNTSRVRVEDLTIDAGTSYANALVFGPTIFGQATFINVRVTGGTTDTFVLGATAGSPDVSDHHFYNMTVQCGASTTNSALKVRGNNTSANAFHGGRISTGSSTTAQAIDIDDGAQIAFHSTNILGNGVAGDYTVIAGSGQLAFFGGHSEDGAGGFLHTISTDPRGDVNTKPHMILWMSHASSATDNIIHHEAHRTLVVTGGFAGGNHRIGTGATVIATAYSFEAGDGWNLEGTGMVYAARSQVPDGGTNTISGARLEGSSVHVPKNTTAAVTSRQSVANTTPTPLIGFSPSGRVSIGGQDNNADSGYIPQIAYYTSGSHPSAANCDNGVILINATDNTITFCANGGRFKVTGTGF